MKTLTLKNKQYTQRGFFDLGFSLMLLAVFGGSAATIESNKDKSTQYVEQQVVSTPLEVPANVAVVNADSE